LLNLEKPHFWIKKHVFMKNMSEMCHIESSICTLLCFDLGSSQFDMSTGRKRMILSLMKPTWTSRALKSPGKQKRVLYYFLSWSLFRIKLSYFPNGQKTVIEHYSNKEEHVVSSTKIYYHLYFLKKLAHG
jgi:hypothetical protein